MSASGLECREDARRRELFRQRATFNGLDFVEVLGGQELCVHFFGEVPQLRVDDEADGITTDNIVVRGGRRIRDIGVVRLEVDRSDDPDRDDCLHVFLDKEGDFSPYHLCVVDVPGFDPRYLCATFSFRVDCPTGLDCGDGEPRAPEPMTEPEIDYQAKDFESFRRLILDRLAVTMPDWRERHAADVGVALVDVLAYAGDHLSYYQDAVATEAYLHTARRRISVRRHARLVDYTLHEGLNARAWVTVSTDSDTPSVAARDLYFITGFPGLAVTRGRALRPEDLAAAAPGTYLVFEPLVSDPEAELRFRKTHSEIAFHTWGATECCLPTGSTTATLRDTEPPLSLVPGDVLVLEEVKGPATGNPADADPAHRHALRLTRVTPGRDDLLGTNVVEIEWDRADALPFPLCLSVRLPAPDCTLVDGVSVARGNVVLVDHGRTVDEALDPVGGPTPLSECACEGGVLEVTELAPTYTTVLGGSPLTFTDPVNHLAAATSSTARDPRAGRASLSLETVAGPPGDWLPQPDLLTSSPQSRHFVAEIDDDGRAHLRFGDGELGARPAARTSFRATYRVGSGPAGNVGREAVAHLVLRSQAWSGVTVRPRNPMPATGGAAPEPTAQAVLLAPDAFRASLKRAITAADYAQLAQDHEGVQAAAAELEWTGSWYEARVAVDVLGSDDPDAVLLEDIESRLRPVRRMGHDLAVVPPLSVPLDLALTVCVEPHTSRGLIKAEVLEILGSGRRADGRLGLFHPDSLTFGTAIRLSRIVAAVQAIPGVVSVEVTRLRRLDHPDAGELDAGVLTVRDLEIARLSGDPSLPERGRLVVEMGGGR